MKTKRKKRPEKSCVSWSGEVWEQGDVNEGQEKKKGSWPDLSSVREATGRVHSFTQCSSAYRLLGENQHSPCLVENAA